MKNWLIPWTAVLVVVTTAVAEVPENGAPDSTKVANRKSSGGKLLPWQEVQPFYWDRATPLHPRSLDNPRPDSMKVKYRLRLQQKPEFAIEGF